MNGEFFQGFDAIQRRAHLASSFFVVAMMVCFSISVVQLMSRITPSWEMAFLPIFGGLVAIEAFYAYNRTRDLTGRSKIIFHLSELFTVAILLKLVTYLYTEPGRFFQDLSRWQNDFMTFLGDGYLFYLFVALLVWLFSFMYAGWIGSLRMEADELLLENPQWIEADRSLIRHQMGETFLAVGIGVILLAFLARLGIPELERLGLEPAISAPVLNVILYFLFGMLLMSQTQFDTLRGQWLRSRTPVSPRLGRAWLVYSLLFFGVIALAAFVLPTRYSFGLLETLNYLFSLLSQFFLAIYFLLLSPLIQALIWLTSLIGDQNEAMPPPMEPLPPADLPAAGAPLPWLELIKSILFWLVFTGLIVLLVGYYLRQNKAVFDTILRLPVIRWLVNFFSGIRRWLRGAERSVAAVVKAGRDRLLSRLGRRSAGSKAGRIDFSRYNPRQKIIYLYLRLIEASAQGGVRRLPHQTPYQYARSLEAAYPDVEEEVEELTGVFIEARYSRHDIGDEQVGFMQQLWRQITTAFRGRSEKNRDS